MVSLRNAPDRSIGGWVQTPDYWSLNPARLLAYETGDRPWIVNSPVSLRGSTALLPGSSDNPTQGSTAGWAQDVVLTRVERLELFVRRIPLPLREWVVRLALLAAIFLFLLRLGLDVQFMRSWIRFLVSLTPLVIAIAVISTVLAILLGVVTAVARLSMSAWARGVASIYASVVRGTPLILQIFFIFIALPQLAGGGPEWLRKALVLNPIVTAVPAISIFHAAYLAEVFRAGFQSVPLGQWEASAAMGMTLRQMKRRIIWPQAIRFALAPTGNHFVMIMKDTALVGFLGVPILFQRAQRIGSQNLRLFETILIAALIYWLLTIAFRRLLGISERRMATAYEKGTS